MAKRNIPFRLAVFLFLSFFCVKAAFAAPKRGAVVSSVYRLDLNSGRVAGENAEYYLDIPAMWQGYLVADREKLLNKKPLERLYFNYPPVDKSAKPVPFLIFEVYDKQHFTPEDQFRKLLETERYIFSVWIGGGEQLTGKTDRAIFGALTSHAAVDHYLISLIRLYAGDEKIYENTVWVNGRQLNTKAITEGNVTYLPAREICESLGYNVGWLTDQKALTLARNTFYHILFLNNEAIRSDYTLLLRNGTAYIPSFYFITKLNLSLEIDERFNVLLNEI